MGISSYSRTPASNTTISGINIAEGCPPSGVNDAIRQLMADIATDLSLGLSLPSATGTANAIVVAMSPAVTAYAAPQRIQFLPTANNTGATTINYGGGVINLQKKGSNGITALAANDVVNGVIADVEYDGTRAVLLNPAEYTQGADIASAATTNLDNATGDYVNVTGTTGITAITLVQGAQRTVQFSGILTLTNGASLVNLGGQNITTAAGDVAVFRGEASGVVRMVAYHRSGSKSTVFLNNQGADIASAGTVNLDTATGDYVNITGTTSITAITLAQGVQRTIKFAGILTLTQGASLLLPGNGSNITTAAGDTATFRGEAAGVVRCVSYTRASGASIVAPAATASVGTQVRKAALQTISNGTNTALNFDTENWDDSNWHNNVTNNSRITIGITSKIRFDCLLTMTPTSNTGMVLMLYKNGTEIYRTSTYTSAALEIGLPLTIEVTAVPTDYFEMFAWHNLGANMNTVAAKTIFSARQVL